jgi:hypothetical protein
MSENEIVKQLYMGTFRKDPEYYTCRAFTRMIAETLGSDGIQLLGEMKRSCHSDDYENNMIKVINEEIQSLKDKAYPTKGKRKNLSSSKI